MSNIYTLLVVPNCSTALMHPKHFRMHIWGHPTTAHDYLCFFQAGCVSTQDSTQHTPVKICTTADPTIGTPLAVDAISWLNHLMHALLLLQASC